MPANTDKLKKLSKRWTGQIGAGGVSDAVVTTIPLSSTTNLATDTAVIATIDRVDINGTATPNLEESVIGVVSNSNLISSVRGVEGTAQAHIAGAVVEILVTAKGYNDIIDGILAEHSQLGVHSSALVTSLKATGANINTGTSDITIVTPKAIADSNVSFPTKTETLTNKTLTTPIIASMYQDAGKTQLMTLPNTASDTLVTLAAAQNLTNKTLSLPILTTKPSTGAADFALDGTNSYLTIANNATANPFGSTNNFSGMVIITSLTSGLTAVFIVGGSTPVILGQTGAAAFTATKDTASHTNFYFDTTALFLQNKIGISQDYCIMAFRTRTGL